MKKLLLIPLLALLSACSGGYSFTGGDVGDAETISIDYFPNYAQIVKPGLSQTFTEQLRDLFVQLTPLALTERNADLEISGSITGYEISPINAQASDVGAVAQNRLTITVNVIFTNTLEPDKSFERSFSRFTDFDANTNLDQVEAQLHQEIVQQLSENILNQAIGDW
jgi:outer membrane lipopolysaccharide assembly protein LptE/RlpB